MSDIAIRVEHLGKKYQLGGQQARYATFRDAIVNTASSPLRWLKGERRPEKEDFWALDDVSFEVKHGEAVGIIGRNGAGKSTLLKILSRITSPTRGRVDIYGRVGSLLEVGTGFHPELTGRENIFLNGAILGMQRVEIARKFDEIVDFSGIEKFLDTPVKHYSSGMYVRLAFAVAAHLEPEILVVDEVLAVGDAEFQKKCLGKMGEVAHEGRTVLFVSHNMVAINNLCRSGIFIQSGRLDKYGEIENVINEYITSRKELNVNWQTCQDIEKNKNIIGRIISVKVMNKNYLPETTLSMTEIIYVEIKYEVIKNRANINLSLHLYNSQDVLVFASPSLNGSGYGGNPHEKGTYTGIVAIPDGLLNQDQYSLSILLVLNRSQVVEYLERIVQFETVDVGDERFGYYGNWGGVIRPKLNWKINKDNEKNKSIDCSIDDIL